MENDAERMKQDHDERLEERLAEERRIAEKLIEQERLKAEKVAKAHVDEQQQLWEQKIKADGGSFEKAARLRSKYYQ